MLNNITLMGRLTRDPELRYSQKNNPVVNFTVAVDRDYNPKDGERQTDFIPIVAWNKLAEFIAKYFHKGDMITLVGRLENRSWTDKDGNKRTSAEINASNAYFCGGAKKTQEPEGFTEEPDDAVLPF